MHILLLFSMGKVIYADVISGPYFLAAVQWMVQLKSVIKYRKGYPLFPKIHYKMTVAFLVSLNIHY